MPDTIVTRKAVTLAGVWCQEVAEQAISDWNALVDSTQMPGWRELSEMMRNDSDAAAMALRTAKPEEYEAQRARAAVADLVTEICRQAERFAFQGVKLIKEKRERPKAARAFADHDDANGARLKAITVRDWLSLPGGSGLIDDLVAMARVHAIMLPRRKEDLEYHQEHIRAIARFVNKIQELLDFGMCAEEWLQEEQTALQKKEQDDARRQ